MSLSSTLIVPTPNDLPPTFFGDSSTSPTSVLTPATFTSREPPLEAPKRVGLSDMNLSKFATLGAAFIVGLETALFPLNTMQTILMSERSGKARSQTMWRLGSHIAKTEGIARFWRGAGTSITGTFTGQSVYYITYETSHEILGTVWSGNGFNFLKGFFSGAIGDTIAGLFYVPTDVVTQRLQTQNIKGFSFTHNSRLYRNGLDVARGILKGEGIIGFWRGYGSYVASFAPLSAVQWGVFEMSKPLIYPLVRPLSPSSKSAETATAAFSGGLAGVSAVCFNNPLEVMRVRIQLLEKRSKKDAESIKAGYLWLARRIMETEGLHAFYRGLKPRLMLTLPGVVLGMTGYETIKDMC